MLAWLHSALVSELEALRALFEPMPHERNVLSRDSSALDDHLDPQLDMEGRANEIADKALEPALGTFRVSITLIVASELYF